MPSAYNFTDAGISWDDNAMSEFRFLTMKEFGGLSRREKLAYLEAATEETGKQPGEIEGRSLFRDTPPAPAIDDVAAAEEPD